MARYYRFVPVLVMAITLALGIVGTIIADVEVVRAATVTASSIDAASDSYAPTSGPSAVTVPGYPY